MSKAEDLEARHRLGRKEYKKRLEAIKAVCDDIQQTRVALAKLWLAEHYPDEAITIVPGTSTLENISMGFELVHVQYEGHVETLQMQRELIAYFDTVGGFRKFTE